MLCLPFSEEHYKGIPSKPERLTPPAILHPWYNLTLLVLKTKNKRSADGLVLYLPRARLNMMSSYQYRNSRYENKKVSRPSFLYPERRSLYWDESQVVNSHVIDYVVQTDSCLPRAWISAIHDDVIKWKHFPLYWSLVDAGATQTVDIHSQNWH